MSNVSGYYKVDVTAATTTQQHQLVPDQPDRTLI
uniref:Uncharacterized protein n=1 Tax=Onchocerca volvulus TaxID=6282 RepID=A0A8R1XRX5_ONCVO